MGRDRTTKTASTGSCRGDVAPDTAERTSRVVVYTRMWISGTGLYAQGLVQGLAAAGRPVTFIAPPGDPDDPAATLAGVTRIMPPRDLSDDVGSRAMARRWRSLRRVARGFGALIAARFTASRFVVTIPEPLIFWLPMLAMLRLSGATVVFVCHDPEPHAWRLRPSLRHIERAAHAANYKLTSRIVVLADTARRALEHRFGVPSDKIAVIPHGAFQTPYAGPIAGNRRLLVFGTIRRNKQVVPAIEAVIGLATEAEHVRLIVAGGIDANDPSYADECRALAASRPDVVTLEMGYVAEDRVAELLQASDAVLLPYTDFESQSGVAVLAGMAGRPVISTAAGGISELIEQGLAATTIASPAGPAQIGDAIRRFFSTPASAWTARSVEGRGKLARALAWREIGQKFSDLLA